MAKLEDLSVHYHPLKMLFYCRPFGEHILCWILDLEKIIAVEISRKIARMPSYSKTDRAHEPTSGAGYSRKATSKRVFFTGEIAGVLVSSETAGFFFPGEAANTAEH